jgi:phage terminase small subunit
MPQLPARIDPSLSGSQQLAEPERREIWQSLTGLQKAWFIEYMQNGYNATQAARDAGYQAKESGSSFRVIGHNNRHHDKISRLIADAFAAQAMSAEEALARVATIARGSIEDMISLDEDGNPIWDLEKAKANGALHLIKDLTLERTEDPQGNVTTKVKITTYDKTKAQKIILRAQGAFDDEDGESKQVNNFYGDINQQLLQQTGSDA